MSRIHGVMLALVVAAAAGCADVSKQDLESLKSELISRDATLVADLKRDLTGIDQKYVTVQQLQMKVEKQLEELGKLQRDLTELGKSVDARGAVAAGQVLKALQFEEKLMSERLAELRLLIEELKKK